MTGQRTGWGNVGDAQGNKPVQPSPQMQQALEILLARSFNAGSSLTQQLNKFPSKQSHSFRGGKNCVPHFRAGGNQKAYKHSENTFVDEQRI